MRLRTIIIIAAVKMVIIAIVLAGWNGFGSYVMAETPAAERAPLNSGVKKSDILNDEKEKGLLALINRRQKELDAREEELKVKEDRLQTVKNDIDTRIAELNKVHASIESLITKVNEVNEERVKKLIKIYEIMNPEEAAPRVEKLDHDTAVTLLAGMSEKKAAKILASMDAGKAVKLMQSLKVTGEQAKK